MLPSTLIRRGWCQRALAVDGVGEEVDPESSEAVAWCLSAAAYVARPYAHYSYLQYLNAVREHIGVVASEWNDAPHRTQAEVLALCLEVERSLNLVEVSRNYGTN